MNPNVKDPVGHISLNFHALDKDKVTKEMMVEIAGKYMERMDIKRHSLYIGQTFRQGLSALPFGV